MTTDNEARLAKVTEVASEIDTLKADVSDKQRALDTVVLDAKTNGAKYREIASAAGRSVAWVQATLNRLGYKGVRKLKREAEEAAAAAAAASGAPS